MDDELDARWMALSSEEKRELLASRKKDSRTQRGAQRNPRGRGEKHGASTAAPSGSAPGREWVDPEVWASMTPQARKAHAKRAKTKARRLRKAQLDSADRSSAKQPERRRRNESQAWRFANYDRVRCNLGVETGWVCGNVQALDEPYPDGSPGTLPYVVMLDKPLSRLISVPSDGSHCVRPEVCFADGAKGGACAEAVARGAGTKRAALRFAVGERVACLTAGPDGAAWPRRWSAGTVRELWPTPHGARAPAAVPYAIDLDSGALRVLAAVDDHMHVRSLELQPAEACPVQRALSRFTVRLNAEQGWDENVDQQTRRVRKRPPQDSESDEEA